MVLVDYLLVLLHVLFAHLEEFQVYEGLAPETVKKKQVGIVSLAETQELLPVQIWRTLEKRIHLPQDGQLVVYTVLGSVIRLAFKFRRDVSAEQRKDRRSA